MAGGASPATRAMRAILRDATNEFNYIKMMQLPGKPALYGCLRLILSNQAVNVSAV
jgi:hypothetical protein